MDRRAFTLGLTTTAFAGLAGCARIGTVAARTAVAPGSLVADLAGLLDLPPGYAYRVISRLRS